MALTLFYHPLFLSHLTGSGHPERPERLASIRSALEKATILTQINEKEPRPASEEELLKVHTEEHIEDVRRLAELGGGALDLDTVLSSSSYQAALLAAGAVISAVDEAWEKEVDAFCLVRPPGHHATGAQAMGFCLFNNVAVGAAYALSQKELSRILVVDWDAHHGNGIQEIFYGDPSVLYISLHQVPLYPGSGSIYEVGSGEGEGYTINIPFPPRAGEESYLKAFNEIIVPAAKEYDPELIMVAAGYDGHFADHIASLALRATSYARMAAVLKSAFELPFVVSLEGGYHLTALAQSVVATVSELAKIPYHFEEQAPPEDKEMSLRVIEEVKKVQSKYWPL